jgi:spore coat protein H
MTMKRDATRVSLRDLNGCAKGSSNRHVKRASPDTHAISVSKNFRLGAASAKKADSSFNGGIFQKFHSKTPVIPHIPPFSFHSGGAKSENVVFPKFTVNGRCRWRRGDRSLFSTWFYHQALKIIHFTSVYRRLSGIIGFPFSTLRRSSSDRKNQKTAATCASSKNKSGNQLPRMLSYSLMSSILKLAVASLPRIGFSLAATLLCLATTSAAESSAPKKASELFVPTKVWNVHLTFTPEQWDAMEPAGGGGFFGGPRRGPGGPGGPGGPDPFGAATFLAPVFFRDGDKDKDGVLAKGEFDSLAVKWFADWDKEKRGRINADELRAGIGAMLTGPGAAANRPGGMNLQGPEGKRNGVAAAMGGVDFKYVSADLDFEGEKFKNVAVRLKGNGTFMESRGSQKRSLKIDLNENVSGQKLAGVTKLNLHNNVTDASEMNEPLSHRLYRDAGVPAPRSSYARVFITVPGKFKKEYFGLYSLIENVDKNFLDHNFPSKKGALLKPVTPDLFSDLGDQWKNYNQTYDPKTDLTPEQKQWIIDFCKFFTKSSDAELAAKFGDYIDIDEFARYMAVMVYLSDLDGILGPGQNFYLYLNPKNQKLTFIPWDQDHSFGQFGMRGTQEQRENLSIMKPWQGQNPFLERVFKIDSFKKAYLARLSDFSKSIFQPERFAKQVDEIAAAIRPAIKEEADDKLEAFDSAVKGEEIAPRGRFGGFGQPLKPIKPFVKIRARSVQDQVAGKSEGQTLGEFGFPGGGGGRRGGPGGFGPGMFLGGAFLNALDANKDGEITKPEMSESFSKWFQEWNTTKSGEVSDEQLRAGINKDLSPFRGGPPPGFAPPQ